MKGEWGEPWVLAPKGCGDVRISVLLLQTQQSRCQLKWSLSEDVLFSFSCMLYL